MSGRVDSVDYVSGYIVRHTFGTLLSNGADLKTIQTLMRHANVSVTMDKYVQAVTPAKREAQRGITGLLDPNGPTRVARQLASD
jgi:site-specific recombinase XerD